MELVPTEDDVVALLRRTGGLRDGHFEYSGGQHITEYLQVALTMRDYAGGQGAERRLEPQGARRHRNSRHDSGAVGRCAGDRRTAGRLRRLRSTARTAGVLGRDAKMKTSLCTFASIWK